jgi:hypothetical protein
MLVRLYLKNKIQIEVGGVWLHSEHEVLGSNPSTAKAKQNTDLEVTEMMELVDKDIKMVTVTQDLVMRICSQK